MQDRDTINQDNNIAYHIRLDEEKTKKRIRSLPVSEKEKQILWSQYFVKLEEPSDDWMLHAKIF